MTLNCALVICLSAVLFVGFSYEFQDLKIGGLFSDTTDEIAFLLSTNEMNEKFQNDDYIIKAVSQNVSYYNTFDAFKGTCSLLRKGLIGLFGPSSPHSSPFIQSICDRKEIPHIEIHSDVKQERIFCSVNLHPHPAVLATVTLDLIKAFHWHHMVILYDNEESLNRVSILLELNAPHHTNIIMRQLESDISESYRMVLLGAKRTGETNYIIDCSIDILYEVLAQAQQVGMMTDNYHYIITSLDMQTIDLSPFQYAGTNITGLRLINPESDSVIKFAEMIQKVKHHDVMEFEDIGAIAAWKLRLRTALVIDAVQLFYETVHDLILSKIVRLNTQPIFCNNSDNWYNGYTIINYMKRRISKGLTGLVKFDYEGFRKDFNLDIMELNIGGLTKIGEWNSTTRRITNTRIYHQEVVTSESSLFNSTFIVITCLTAPYAMLKETSTQLIGNDRFEGFGIDIIQELSQLLGFNYTIIIQDDGNYGTFDKVANGWNGMLKEIIDERAHFGIVDLTITSDRENAVDFTMPFMNLGICILYRKPEPVPPSLFMFASPFSISVWLMLGIAYCLVSASFFIMGRLSPAEWVNPYPCIEEPEFLINQFSIRNCLWFTVGALMQQGSELEPKSISTRTASGVWWFFTLIMVSSYTANLAAFLTVETLVTSFKNIEELAKQQEIKYGAKKDGATANFFRDSNITTYQKIWQYMMSHPDVMMHSNSEAVRRVETENYAFFMESSTIEYETERHCTLGKVGNLLDDKGYGIAMKKYSPYRNEMSRAVLKLQETGRLAALKIKWWNEKRGGGKCASKSEGGDATPLDLKNVGGVFMVLVVGSILGLMGSFMEMACHVYKETKAKNQPFKQELIKKIRYVVKVKNSTMEVTYDEIKNDTPEDTDLLKFN